MPMGNTTSIQLQMCPTVGIGLSPRWTDLPEQIEHPQHQQGGTEPQHHPHFSLQRSHQQDDEGDKKMEHDQEQTDRSPAIGKRWTYQGISSCLFPIQITRS